MRMFRFADPKMLLKSGCFTKGSAYTEDERRKLGLIGLLPHQVETLELQVKRSYQQFLFFESPLSKYIYLAGLRDRSETIFFALLIEHLSELLPYVYTPTIGAVCQNFGQLFRYPEGMYVRLDEDIERVLRNWKNCAYMSEDERITPSIIVITDGSRILGLGDLGINGMGIPIGKLALYVAVGGFHPMACLPITVDVGTNNSKLIQDPFYMGSRNMRPERSVYIQFMDRLINTLSRKWPQAVIQFEDVSRDYCFDFLKRYRTGNRLFNDDIQGTGVVAAAAVVSAMNVMRKKHNIEMKDHKIVIFGFGSSAIGVAEQIISTLVFNDASIKDKAKRMFYMVDSKGLVTVGREKLPSYKRNLAREDDCTLSDGTSLSELIMEVKPTILIGLAGQAKVFTREICELMSSSTPSPAIFALSNPTSQAEVLFKDAFEWTGGNVIYCSGSPMEPVIREDGTIQACSQCNNLYAFPGIGFGAWLSQTNMITDKMLTIAVNAIVRMTSQKDLASGFLFPPISDIAEVSDVIAAAIYKEAQKCQDSELVTLNHVKSFRYQPEYCPIKKRSLLRKLSSFDQETSIN